MITVLNAAPDTGNQGVSALCHSVVSGLWQRGERALTVADHGRGTRRARLGEAEVDLVGLTHNRRFWRTDNLRASHALARIGVPGTPSARAIVGSRAVVDISGGDSFTDLYGPKRFRAMVLSKRMALAAGVPLILLPQKLGPFTSKAFEAEAFDILRRAAAVWVRDAESFALLRRAVGASFDPSRHRLAVDVAVALPEQRPQSLDRTLQSWVTGDRRAPLAGLNVSGLLCNDGEQARQAFGLTAPHADQLATLARALLESDPRLRLVLIPHVHRPLHDPESDLAAAQALKARLGPSLAGRVQCIDAPLTCMELKWVLARLDWFAGARMHATIGAFSSAVSTLGLGYSDKAAGVFAECGIAEEVVDLRRASVAEIAGRAVASFANRDRTRADLTRRVAGLRARAALEMDMIAAQARP